MRRDLFLWQFGGFALTALLGTVLHFVYDWTGQSPLVAPFSGINESTWEHMKLLYWPMLLVALVQSRYFRDVDGYWWVKLVGAAVGLAAIPILFYTYNGAFGTSPDWLNITFFFVAAAAAYGTEWLLLSHDVALPRAGAPLFVLLGVGALFVLFTYAPPDLPLFKEPSA